MPIRCKEAIVDQCKGLIAEGLFKDYDDIRNSPTQSCKGTTGRYQV